MGQPAMREADGGFTDRGAGEWQSAVQTAAGQAPLQLALRSRVTETKGGRLIINQQMRKCSQVSNINFKRKA